MLCHYFNMSNPTLPCFQPQSSKCITSIDRNKYNVISTIFIVISEAVIALCDGSNNTIFIPTLIISTILKTYFENKIFGDQNKEQIKLIEEKNEKNNKDNIQKLEEKNKEQMKVIEEKNKDNIKIIEEKNKYIIQVLKEENTKKTKEYINQIKELNKIIMKMMKMTK